VTYRPLEIGLLADGSHHAGLVYTTNRQFRRGDPSTFEQLVRALDALLREGSGPARSLDLPDESRRLTSQRRRRLLDITVPAQAREAPAPVAAAAIGPGRALDRGELAPVVEDSGAALGSAR